MMRQHTWEQKHLRENDPEMSRDVMMCKRCGAWTEMVMPGVPNLNGAIPIERDCDLVIIRKVMLS